MAQNTQYMNARHISSDSRYQIQEKQWFEIVVDKDGSDLSALTFLTKSCNLPKSSNTGIKVPFGNSDAYVAGKREYTENTFTFMDAIKEDVEKKLYDWQSLAYNPQNGSMGWVDEYKRTIRVTEYGPNGSRRRTWEFTGCWPESIDYGELSNESADGKDIQVTIRFDEAKRVETPTEYAALAGNGYVSKDNTIDQTTGGDGAELVGKRNQQ